MSRTFGRGSVNIANPSKSENCQDNFQDLQKDFVILRDLMLLVNLSGVQAASSPKRRAFLLAKIPLKIVLLKAFSSGRSVSQATVEFALQTSSMRCKKERLRKGHLIRQPAPLRSVSATFSHWRRLGYGFLLIIWCYLY